MALTDEQFTEWLQSEDQHRVVLATFHPYSKVSESVETYYWGSKAFITRDTDTPAVQLFDDVLTGVPTITRRLNQAFIGEATSSWGDAELRNFDGEFNDFIDDDKYAWDGREAVFYIGDMRWPFADFRLLFKGVVSQVLIKDDYTLTLRLRDKRHLLDRPVIGDIIEGTGTINDGEPYPFCYGYCRNVEPRLIDPATHKYAVHHGTAISTTATGGSPFQVRDNGVPISVTVTGTTANWDGTFTLSASPAGRITMSLRGGKSQSGSNFFTHASLLEELIVGLGILDSADVDPDFFSDLRTEELEGWPPAESSLGTCGYYIRERKNLVDVMNDFSRSMQFWYGFSREGLLTGGFIGTGTPVVINADDVKSMRHIGRSPPWIRARVGYLKNWTPQDPDSLAGSVSAELREEWASPHSVIVRENVLDVSAHETAEDPPVIETLYSTKGGATGTFNAKSYGAYKVGRDLVGYHISSPGGGTTRLGLFSKTRDVFEVVTNAVGFDFELGQSVKVKYPFFGFEEGVTATVIGITLQPLNKSVTLELRK